MLCTSTLKERAAKKTASCLNLTWLAFSPRVLKERVEPIRGILFNAAWKPAANGIGSVEYVQFEDFFEDITASLEHKQIHLVFWSIYESLVLKTFLPISLFSRLEPYLYNLHPPAKKYLNRKSAFGINGTAKGKTPEECFAALRTKRQPYPPLPLGAAEACRRIDTASAAHKKWRQFSDKQKSYVSGKPLVF